MRRLAGPGLGCAVTRRLMAIAAGRLSLGNAALPSAAAGGGREQSVKQGSPRATLDKRLCPLLLLLTLGAAGDRRREELSPST